MKKMTFVVDVDRCIGCRGCQAACKMENKTALGSHRTTVKPIENGKPYPEAEMYFLPVMCQHCEEPSCVAVCPTEACYINEEDGTVLIDKSLCIGCKACFQACPYQVNNFNEEMRIMDKCTICVEKREEGKTPACVKTCCGEALHVGDINDPESEVSKMLAEAGEENVYQLKDFGNKPTVRYILRNDTWIDVMPQDCLVIRKGK